MTVVRFHDEAADALLRFAVVIARHRGKWVLCRHRERDTYEVPGGHREQGEAILATAKRELYEETGAVGYTITPVCVYSVTSAGGDSDAGEETYGMLFYAEIEAFEGAPHSEIEEVLLSEALPGKWTYPAIQPKLIEKAEELGFIK